MQSEKTIEVIHGEGDPTHAIIWLHGLGATADDFVPVVPHLGLAATPAIRFVFPQAPNRPITINGGMAMPGWYDIKGPDLKDKEDLEGMVASRSVLEALIDQQIKLGIESRNIIIAGFSQGGAVVYYTGLRTPHRLAGILALSTYLPFQQEAKAQQSCVNQQTPILAMHGQLDPVVPINIGRASYEALLGLGYQVDWKDYSMEHNVIPEQIAEIGQWINGLFAK